MQSNVTPLRKCEWCGNTFRLPRPSSHQRYCCVSCKNLARRGTTLRVRGEIERFWSKVEKSNECWEWTSGARDGYGRFHLVGGRVVNAHRYSFEIVYGSIPDGMMICHKCDNRKCVRPDHLFLGTARDNAQDRAQKGRGGYTGSPGSAQPQAKLTESKVTLIRKLDHAGNMSRGEIASKFGVTQQTVCDIVKRRSWKHIP